MQTRKSNNLFTSFKHTRVNFHPEHQNTPKAYSVTIKEGMALPTLFDSDAYYWREAGRFKTYDEAYEFANSRGDKVIYEGIYENGNRKGMM